MRIVSVEPSLIVTLPSAPAAGNVPLVTVTLSTRTSAPSNGSPEPSASCASVTVCGVTAGSVPAGSSVTVGAEISVRPWNCASVPVTSTLSPIAKLNVPVVLKTSTAPVAS